MRSRVGGLIACIYLTACIILGGASAGGALANAVLQMAGLVLIPLVLWRDRGRMPREAHGPLWVWAVFLLVGLLTLAPMPPSLWTALPYRDGVAAGYRLAGLDLPSLPISLSVHGTLASLLSLISPAAVFLLVMRLSSEERHKVAWTVMLVASVSIILGASQLIGGPDSPLRPYQVTNPNAAVGFFANRNHQATLLLCALPFTGALLARVGSRSRANSKRSAAAVLIVAMALFFTTGIAISGSAAGYGLFLISALVTLLIYRRSAFGRVGWRWGAGLGLLLLTSIVIGLVGPFSTQTLSEEMSDNSTSRRVIAETTLEAIRASSPVGTGLGTFSTVYRQFEEPNPSSRVYINHAHNDYLEIVLELGFAGIMLVMGFVLWWVRQSLRVWRTDFAGASLARAASVILGVVLLHSTVDYPIRTAAIAALFAMACSFMVPSPSRPRQAGDASLHTRVDGLRHLEAA